MKIAVVGAGGVGGYYGALLAAAGNEVHFVARGPHLDAMRKSGLHVRSILGDLNVEHVRATDRPTEIGAVDLVLICTKSFDTRTAARQCQSLVGPETTVLSLQNGVDAADTLASILGPSCVIAGATWISSSIEGPGVIRHISDSRRIVLGELDGGESTRVGEISRLFHEAGISVEISGNMQVVLWAKLMFVAAVAGVGSLTGLPIAAYRDVPQTRLVLQAMMRETADVAAAAGVLLETHAVEQALQYIDAVRPEIKASMQLDMEAGRPSELEALIGVIVRKAGELGISTPIVSTVYGLLLPVELRLH